MSPMCVGRTEFEKAPDGRQGRASEAGGKEGKDVSILPDVQARKVEIPIQRSTFL